MGWKSRYGIVKEEEDYRVPIERVLGREKEEKEKAKRKVERRYMKQLGGRIRRLEKRKVGRRKGLPKERKFKVGARRLIGAIAPVELPRRSYSYSERAPKRRVGRPRGPSGKYVIPGVGPVGVYEWRRWYRKQLALQRTEVGRRPQEYYVETPPESESAQQIQQASQAPPQSDNILNAPNFMRGELQNVGRSSSITNVDDLNRPITNKEGDYYTEVDPASGQQILKRRIRERWLSNE